MKTRIASANHKLVNAGTIVSGRVERLGSYHRGHVAESVAAFSLWLKGYRILARRHKSRLGEIDLILKKGSMLVFVEVKARKSLEEAEASLSRRQSMRMRRAAALWIARHASFQEFDQRFDAVFVIRGQWPIHCVDGA